MGSTDTAYGKQNTTYPIERVASGWRRVALAERYEAAVSHFLETPKGSLWRDPDYGTKIYMYRTQTMTDPRDEESLLVLDVQQGFQRYFPDLLFKGLTITQDHENEKRTCHVAWIVRGADRHVHGDLAEPRKTPVLI